jgi:hypothetical protein
MMEGTATRWTNTRMAATSWCGATWARRRHARGQGLSVTTDRGALGRNAAAPGGTLRGVLVPWQTTCVTSFPPTVQVVPMRS